MKLLRVPFSRRALFALLLAKTVPVLPGFLSTMDAHRVLLIAKDSLCAETSPSVVASNIFQ
jgi:hypothetical protein